MCHHYKGEMWHDHIDDVATPQGATWADLYIDWEDELAGDSASMQSRWTNHMMIRGKDEPMRGCHMDTSHWPIMVKFY
jgi:hypothetical protein